MPSSQPLPFRIRRYLDEHTVVRQWGVPLGFMAFLIFLLGLAIAGPAGIAVGLVFAGICAVVGVVGWLLHRLTPREY